MASHTFTVFKGGEGNIVQSETTRPALSGNEVLVAITASGLCGGDLMFRGNDMVLGHEGVGVVAATGPDAKILKKGDRVGWGFLQDVCGSCQQCEAQTDNFCPERKMYGFADHDQGSLAYGIVKKETRLFSIPAELSDEEAAPLMCAGATVYNVFDTYGIKSGDRVGVVGLGGLGHLAIQFAAKKGCDVVSFSNTASKEADALSFGASAYYTLEATRNLQKPGSIDVLIITAPMMPDWSLYLPLLAPKAKIFPLTIGPENVSLPGMPLLMMGITVQGSVLAPKGVHERMLEFAAKNGVKPKVHRFNMDLKGVEEAFATLKEGRMRYRGVLVVPEDKKLVV